MHGGPTPSAVSARRLAPLSTAGPALDGGHSSWLCIASERGAGLVEIEDFAVRAELVKIPAGHFTSACVIEAAGFPAVATSSADP